MTTLQLRAAARAWARGGGVSAGHEIAQLVRAYGPWAVGGVVALECLGVPVPGESVVVGAALLAAAGHGPPIALVVGAAAVGASIGGHLGHLIGARFGYPLLVRYGPRLGLTAGRLRLGRYLFREHGAAIVFLGRFVAILRAFAGLLAGASGMPWQRFLVANAAGAVVWATTYGYGAFLIGDEARRLSGPLGIALGGAAVAALATVALLIHRHAGRLQQAADRAEAAAAGGPDA